MSARELLRTTTRGFRRDILGRLSADRAGGKQALGGRGGAQRVDSSIDPNAKNSGGE